MYGDGGTGVTIQTSSTSTFLNFCLDALMVSFLMSYLLFTSGGFALLKTDGKDWDESSHCNATEHEHPEFEFSAFHLCEVIHRRRVNVIVRVLQLCRG